MSCRRRGMRYSGVSSGTGRVEYMKTGYLPMGVSVTESTRSTTGWGEYVLQEIQYWSRGALPDSSCFRVFKA